MAVIKDNGHLKAIVNLDNAAVEKFRVVNIEDHLKWKALDCYNLAVPTHERIMDLQITSEPLPRTRLGKLKRFKIQSLSHKNPAKMSDHTTDSDSVSRSILDFLTELSTQNVTVDKHLELDLGLDSLDKIEFQVFLESTFDLELADDDFSRLSKVGDIIQHIRHQGNTAENHSISWKDILSQPLEDFAPQAAPGSALLFRILARPLFKTYFRLKVEGFQNLPRSPFILVANHQSYLDGLLLAALMPQKILNHTFFFAKEKQFYHSMTGRYLAKGLNVVEVNLDRGMKTTILKIAAILKTGRNMVIFPEGMRSRDGRMAPFKRSFAILSRELKVPVVPVAIRGTYRLYPRGRLWPRPGTVTFKFMPPTTPVSDDYADFTRGIREQILAEVENH